MAAPTRPFVHLTLRDLDEHSKLVAARFVIVISPQTGRGRLATVEYEPFRVEFLEEN
jgi:hypothetical protein